jgi:hypothetical protein
MVPVSHSGQDQLAEVAEEELEGLTLCRRRGRQASPDVAGTRRRRDRKGGDPAEVIGDPVYQRMAVAAELVGLHRP